MQNYFLTTDMHYSALHQLPIEPTGSGDEFFWEWIVNLLLMFVNFALHYPPNQACYCRGAEKQADRVAASLAYFSPAATNMKSRP